MNKIYAVICLAAVIGYGVGRWQVKPIGAAIGAAIDVQIAAEKSTRSQRLDDPKCESNRVTLMPVFSMADLEAKLLAIQEAEFSGGAVKARLEWMQMLVGLDPEQIPGLLAFIDKQLVGPNLREGRLGWGFNL